MNRGNQEVQQQDPRVIECKKLKLKAATTPLYALDQPMEAISW